MWAKDPTTNREVFETYESFGRFTGYDSNFYRENAMFSV